MKCKRLLAMLLAVMMVVTALPVGVLAEESVNDEPQLNLYGEELDLYWVKYQGLNNGVPNYNTSRAANSMWDEVGEDIDAVFLLGDGNTFTEVPFEELVFPAGLNYSQIPEYENAVHMEFDTALEANITYTKDGITYEFPLEVELIEEEPLETGLYWCGIHEPENGVYEPQTDELKSELTLEIGSWEWVAVYFYDGEKLNLLKPGEDLTVSDNSILDAELLDDTDYYFSISADRCGEDAIAYTVNGEEYTLPVLCMLPSVGIYSAPQRTEENLVTADLSYTGEDEDEADKNCTIYYILGTDENQIVRAEVLFGKTVADPSEVRIEVQDDKTAMLYIYEDFQFDVEYKVNLYNDSQRFWGDWFNVRDESGAGGGNTDSSTTIGYYGSKSGAADTSLGKGEGVITGEVGETVIAYLVWDPAETGALEEMLVSFRPAGMNDNLLDSQPIGGTAAALAEYNVTLTLNEQAGYVQVEAVIGNSINVGLAPVFGGIASRYWLSIDPKQSGGSGDNDDEPLTTGLYWCSRGDVQTVLNGDTAPLEKDTLETEINGTVVRALFFVNGDEVILLDSNADLLFGEYAEAKWEKDENCFYVRMWELGEYEITYTHTDGKKYTLPVEVLLPQFGLYSGTTASLESFLGEEILFAGNPTTVYLVCREDSHSITGLKVDARDSGADMTFLSYSISANGKYIELKIGENVSRDKEYTMEVYYQTKSGRNDDDRVSFTVVKKDPTLLWFPVEEDGNGGYEVTDTEIHRNTLTCLPQESILMQICWFDGARYTVLDLDDLELPGFVTAQTVDADNGILRITCDELDIGEITSDQCPGWSIKITVQSDGVLGFYTHPEISGAYADQDFNGDRGDTVTRYLMWDQTLLPNVDKVTVTLNDGEGNGNVLVDADVATTDLSEWDIELTSDLENRWVKVEAKIAGWRNVTFKVWKNGVAAASVNVNIDEDYDRWNENGMVLEYDTGNGIVPLTINMGRIRNGYVNLGGWNSLGGLKDELEHDLILGALAFEGEQNESDAPASFYEAISDVRFEVSKWVNEDGSGDQTESNIWFGPVTTTMYNGMKLYGAQILGAPGGFGHIQVAITFTLTVGGKDTTYTFYESFAYNLAADFTIELEDLDTADKLNAVLGTPDGLENWMEENEPATIAAMRRLKAQGEIVELEVVLPPVEYTDIIDYRVVTEFSRLTLCGSEDKKGNRTTLPGLRTENNTSFFLSDLDFVADPLVKQSYKGEKFTCGVLMYGSKKSDISKVMDCTFEGFDYGVRTTTAGYTCCWDCQFVNCEIAYLLDCEGKEQGNSNADMLNCLFVNCGTGVRIKHLPEYITPYGYRVYNCDFIGNDMDIDVSQRGRFYFYQNYYGDPKHKNDPVEEAKDVHKRPPRVRGRGYADVVVNPRWSDPVTLDGSNHSSNHLIVDTKHGLANYMFNDDALGWSFDSSILNTDLSNQNEGVSLAMTNDEEETIGTWNLEGGAAQAQLLSLFAEEAADTFCPALNIREKNDGSIQVTVDDSDLFAQRKVTLTIPCDVVLAAVTFEDQPVASITANGQVTFTVEEGGTYVISEALTEDAMKQSFIAGGAPEVDEGENVPEAEVEIGWFDFNAQDDTEDTSFVQIGTATQQTVQQVNPDAENLGDAEDVIVETEVITVQAVYQAPESQEDITITVLLVLYDSNGRMIAMQEQSAQQNEGTRVITVECDSSLIDTAAVTVRAFVISADGSMSPLAPVPFSQTMPIPAK